MWSYKLILVGGALVVSSAAHADIIAISPSMFNDGNVFADGNQRGTTVNGTFDGGVIDFTGMNTQNNFLTTFTGGQARFQGDFTGQGNSTYDLTELIFQSQSGDTFSTVEFRLFGLGSNEDATIELTDDMGMVFSFTTDSLRASFGGGADRFAFQGINNQTIARVRIVSDDGFQDLRQLRLGAAMGAIPEPSVWAMLIIGFGAIGASLRRRQSVAFA